MRLELVTYGILVRPDHLLRKIGQAIDFRFIYDLCAPLYCADRLAADPVILFRILFVGYLCGIRSRSSVKRLARTPFPKDGPPPTRTMQQSKTDPDSGQLRREGKPDGFHYSEHRTVDSKNNLIVPAAWARRACIPPRGCSGNPAPAYPARMQRIGRSRSRGGNPRARRGSFRRHAPEGNATRRR